MEERLTVLAEISVGLAGFSSVVVTFRRRTSSGAWKPEDVFRFRIMLEAGLFAGLFALLPAAFLGLGVAPPVLWPSLTALLLAHLAFDLARKVRQFRRLPSGSLNRKLTIFSVSMILVVSTILGASLIGRWTPAGPGAYLFGVTWLTVYSGITFYRLITAPIEAAGADA